MNNIVTEGFIKFRCSFIASTSDFWHDPQRKKSFGASIANMMTKHYEFHNGLCLAVSDTTLGAMKRDKCIHLIKVLVPIILRLQMLLDFLCYLLQKTGYNIGMWLDACHRSINAKPDYIGSHVVDGAGNAGALVSTLEWLTADERSQKVVSEKCDAHKCNTTANIASGTSDHVVNLNPDLGADLKHLHEWLGKIERSGERKKVVETVRKEHGRTKTPRIESAVTTRWNSRHKETICANCNQYDLDVAIKRMVCVGGVDEKMYVDCQKMNDFSDAFINEDQWIVYHQYEAGMQPLKDFSQFCQSAQVIVHWELFEAHRAIEQLSAQFFVMCENVSIKNCGTDRMASDLTKREKKYLVLDDYFAMPKPKFTSEYDNLTEVDMHTSIKLAKRLAWRHFSVRLGFVTRSNTVSGAKSVDLDAIVDSNLMAGFENAPQLGEYKILGAMINPLMQNQAQMIDTGLCTQEQFDHGKEELLSRMTRYYESKSPAADACNKSDSPVKTNKYSMLQSESIDYTSPQQQAIAEFERFQKYNDIAYLPDMEPVKILGWIDENGDPKEPVYKIGPVVRPGKNLDHRGRNHADYVDKSGGYDIVHYLIDFEDRFPALTHVGIGQLAPHITTEVDCESLFSQSGFLSHPRRAQTNTRTYERLVIGKHRLQRIYCHVPDVIRLYMERHSKNDWDEKDNRDDISFLEIEKEIWKEQFPHCVKELEEEEEDVDNNEEDDSKEEVDEDSDDKDNDESSSSSSSSSGIEVVGV